MPQQHRHDYAADFHHGLQEARKKHHSEFPRRTKTGDALQPSPYPPYLSWRYVYEAL